MGSVCFPLRRRWNVLPEDNVGGGGSGVGVQELKPTLSQHLGAIMTMAWKVTSQVPDKWISIVDGQRGHGGGLVCPANVENYEVPLLADKTEKQCHFLNCQISSR